MANLQFVLPLYYKDLHQSTQHWNDEEVGAYIRLLIHQWSQGEIPKDIKRLTRIAESAERNWELLKTKFSNETATGFQNQRMVYIKDEVSNHQSKQKNNGELGGRPTIQQREDWHDMILFFENKCVCCGYKFIGDAHPTKDHILPKKDGGTEDIFNLQPLCRNCNSSKSDTHTTDYRLKYIDKIPENLQLKWFPKNPPITHIRSRSRSRSSNEEIKKEIDHFNDFRVAFPGTKRGNETEFTNFKKHPAWKDYLPLLLPAVQKQIRWRANQTTGTFIPQWKNLKTWINQKCWEDILPGMNGSTAPVVKVDVKKIAIQYPDHYDEAFEKSLKSKPGYPETMSEYWEHLTSKGWTSQAGDGKVNWTPPQK